MQNTCAFQIHFRFESFYNVKKFWCVQIAATLSENQSHFKTQIRLYFKHLTVMHFILFLSFVCYLRFVFDFSHAETTKCSCAQNLFTMLSLSISFPLLKHFNVEQFFSGNLNAHQLFDSITFVLSYPWYFSIQTLTIRNDLMSFFSHAINVIKKEFSRICIVHFEIVWHSVLAVLKICRLSSLVYVHYALSHVNWQNTYWTN